MITFLFQFSLFNSSPEASKNKNSWIISVFSSTLLLWMIMKAAFVRDDGYHVIYAALGAACYLVTTLGFSTDRFSILLSSGNLTFVMLGLALPFTMIASLSKDTPQNISFSRIINKIISGFADTVKLYTPNQETYLASKRREVLNSIKMNANTEKYSIPKGASADILSGSGEVTSLIANGITYSPRPVPQSYSAYTSKLQMANWEFFNSHIEKPDYLIIDLHDSPHGDLPLGLDSPSLLSIYRDYEFGMRGSQGSLIFRRKSEKDLARSSKTQRHYNDSCPTISSGELAWNTTANKTYWESNTISLPANPEKPITISFEAQNSLLRKLSSILYRPTLVRIEYIDSRGKAIRTFRLIPMAGRELLVFPIVQNNDELLPILKNEPLRDPSPSTLIHSDPTKKLNSEITGLRFSTTSLGIPFKSFFYRLTYRC